MINILTKIVAIIEVVVVLIVLGLQEAFKLIVGCYPFRRRASTPRSRVIYPSLARKTNH